MDVGFSGFICVGVFGDTLKRDVLAAIVPHLFIKVYYIFSPFNIQEIMSNEESLLALLQESLGNGQRTNAPIIINNNYFNAPVGQHNDHVESVNLSASSGGLVCCEE